MEQVDVVIAGAGVIGLSIAAQISRKGLTVFVIEKHNSFGQEISSRNSEVIHAGIYYPQKSLKAKTCIEGNRLLYEICNQNNIPYRKVGKLIVAIDSSEIQQLEKLFKNALENGIKDLRMLAKEEIKKLEPNIKAIAAIYSPATGIIDSHKLMEYFILKAKDAGAEIVYNSEIKAIDKEADSYRILIKDADGEDFSFLTKIFVNCSGLNSDNVANMVGIDIKKENYTLKYSKGEYFRMHNSKKRAISHLIYPVPDPKGVGLGIHLTLDLVDGLRLGPDAQYISRDKLDYNIDIAKKKDFYDSVKRFFPFINLDDLYPDIAGIRPVLKKSNEEFRDFVIKHEQDKGLTGFINLIGIESPGLTGAPAIAKYVANMINNI